MLSLSSIATACTHTLKTTEKHPTDFAVTKTHQSIGTHKKKDNLGPDKRKKSKHIAPTESFSLQNPFARVQQFRHLISLELLSFHQQ